jgi:hypothetical protein
MCKNEEKKTEEEHKIFRKKERQIAGKIIN